MKTNSQNINLNHSDQRYFPRWEVANRVMFRLHRSGSTWSEAQTKDLSCSGVCLRTAVGLILNQGIRLKIYLSDEAVINVDGIVAWIRGRQPNGESDIGILFSNITKDDQDIILNHAFELNPKKLNDLWYQGWDS